MSSEISARPAKTQALTSCHYICLFQQYKKRPNTPNIYTISCLWSTQEPCVVACANHWENFRAKSRTTSNLDYLSMNCSECSDITSLVVGTRLSTRPHHLRVEPVIIGHIVICHDFMENDNIFIILFWHNLL